jgi:microcystin-dependent protein
LSEHRADVASSLAPAGGGLPHNNMTPYLTVNFCIALQGIYPARG